MNETLTKLQTVVVDASAPTSVTFSNIPQSYTDLKIVVSIRNSRSGFDRAPLTMRLGNGSVDTGSNYSYRDLQGIDGSTAATTSSGTYIQIGNTPSSTSATSTFGNMEIYIPNYTSSTAKSISVDYGDESTSTSWMVAALGGLWNNTAPINIITFQDFITSSSFLQYSTFTLYGVKNLANVFSNSIKATGGTITTDGNYVYHTFNTSGSFIPNTRLFADYLVIAGGGGSGASGAGAGGLRSTLGISGGAASPESQIQLLPGTSYSVVVGAGGSGSSNGQSSNGSNGNNSSFGTITAIGGGGGITSGGSQLNTGLTGGSGSGGYGGGDGTSNGSSAPGGSGTLGQGYAGGSSAPKASATSSSGGGGGAGAVGANAATTNTAGAGGNGVYLSGFSVATNTGLGGYYAGGGGGGYYVSGAFTLGGLGGGGAGSSANAPGSSGTSNTGGGAGGAYSESYKTAAYSGGSGLVVVRYKA